MNSIKEVAVIGLGYIGLPTAAILASKGITVKGVDVSPRTVEAVNKGEVPFVEPALGEFVAEAVSQGTLSASFETPEAEAYIVAVPTPFNEDHSADLSYIEAAADGIAPKLKGGELVILESTSPPGATEHMADYLLSKRPDLSKDNLLIAHCPERVLPGYVMEELVTNDRIVGGITPEAADKARELYETFCEAAILTTDAKTAEMAKLVENSYRDVNIAFANELSVISDKLGIDVWELINLANRHPRVNILQPGPGVGGHCIAVDPWFIVAAAPEESGLIKMARDTNDAKPNWVINKVKEATKAEDFNGKVAVMGLAFKANIDDMRESPAIAITRKLAEGNPDVEFLAVEPHVEVLPNQLGDISNLTMVSTEDALQDASVVTLLVDHDQFKAVPATALAGKAVVDTRGLWR
ncbi:UDP-N-acetyl-D-glucosamine 6-dehydrogenase [Glutamicibacter creatinolyticus]|uniref:UDP-N-acetyl-D-glucosamine 6-dehydrogenase n=1 Tax=Glutamicibacter creatinolyticus TaxID=162496 RepID=A0A5B7WS20_9MICC|nr:UDP-N-acetyl-D-mannosamine dehydrogenase [Glutamicibacter creatinolyticus]QCY46936.1 UDP-N-acetyl-D-glucosamine 6-dehydrogenase [Glutamicibacter creatinolyticus]